MLSVSSYQKYTLSVILILYCACGYASGNTFNQSFNKAKRYLEQSVYHDHRETLYCGAKFDEKKAITLPDGFVTTKHKKRQHKIEWEHVVPAENFGRTFAEWRDGHKDCVDNKGKSFKGRKCAEKVNLEFRYMQSDMYILFPAIGSVNAMRSNYNFVAYLDVKTEFGSCDMPISDNKAVPPERARGQIARTYLYMHETYSRYKMSKQQRQLMNAWDKMYPVSEWECIRSKRIEKIQGNKNSIMESRCI